MMAALAFWCTKTATGLTNSLVSIRTLSNTWLRWWLDKRVARESWLRAT
jgi:hypothetical protein